MKKSLILLLTVLLQNIGYSADYKGTYSGTYSGGESGTWQVEIDASGNIAGYIKDPWGDLYYGTGKVQTNGVAGIVMSGATFSGQINAAGYFTGTWANSGAGITGTFSGRRKPVQLTVVNGSGSGLYVSGTKVTIRATIPLGMKFSNWNDSDTNSPRIITMPSDSVTYSASFIDIQKPTVAITAPTVSLRILGTNPVYTVKGTATDNGVMTGVFCRVNGGEWTPAATTNNWKSWSIPFALTAGSNLVQAFSADSAGNLSLTSKVSCTYVVIGNLNLQTNGLGAVTRSPIGLPEVNRTYTLTATPRLGSAFVNWTGDAVSTNKVLNFTMNSNSTFTANFIDIQKPTVAITTPTASLRILGTNPVYTIKGTATDNGVMTGVFCRVNGGEWTPAATTNNWKSWSIPLALTAGSNLVQAFSADSTGNLSLTSKVSCTYVVIGNLSLQTNGVGTITRTPIGLPEVNRTYTLTATPRLGSAFVNWTGDAVSTNKVLNLTMNSNSTFTANFIDIQKPTVVITTPTASLRILGTNPVYTVKGTATDNGVMTGVFCRVNSGEWTAAVTTNGWKSWSVPLALTAGSNLVQAFSADSAGNLSLTSKVSCTYVVAGNLSLQTNGVGTITRTPVGLPEVNRAYTLTATPRLGSEFVNWTGDAVSTNKVLNFTMNSNSTFTANFRDIQKPTVAITAPTASLRISNEVYTVKGTAADNGTLTNVLCQINGAWTNAMTTNSWKNWSVPVVLREGSNLVQACSVDSDKNVSSFASVSCTYVVTSFMTVQKTGAGAVSPDLNGQALEIGRNYTMTATPGAGSVFINWTYGVGGEVATNKSAITFMMQSNLVLTANFLGLPDLSEDGLSALSKFLNTNSISYGDAMMIADAAEAFDLATKSNPNNYTNRIYNAVAIMLNLVNNSAVRTQAEIYGLNLDDLFNPAIIFPASAPAVNDSVDTFAAAVLPAIDKAWAELNAVPATWAGRIEISTNRFSVDESVWVDTGDVTAMKAALKGLRAFVGLLKAYSLNVDYNRLIDPVATPQKAITVDGSIADWTNVPRSLVTFDYPEGMGTSFAVTQEVAVALDGTNIALLVTGCPFTISDSVSIWFSLRLSNGAGINSNRNCSVDLWTSGSVIYGMADGLKIDGLETALVNGVLEVKFPVPDGQATSQVTIEEVGCGMNFGGPYGYWGDVFSLVPPSDTPISILRANHPEFFSKVRNPTSLAGAKVDLQAALNSYLAADTMIGKRSGDNAGLLHLVDSDPTDPLAEADRLETRTNVTRILTSLTSAVQLPAEEAIEGTATRAVFLGALFNAPYITTNILPSGLKGTLKNPSWIAFPNPTFNGTLPGMTSTNLAKYLLGYTGARVETVRDFSADAYYAYELLFNVETSRRNMTITNITVSGTGIPTMSLDVWENGGWGYYDYDVSPPATGSKYTFTVEFADGSRETIYDTIAWITVDPKPVLTGTMLRWSSGVSVPNADHYSVYTSYGNWDLPLTQTSLDLSAFGYVAGDPCMFEVDIVNKNWDISTHWGEYPAP